MRLIDALPVGKDSRIAIVGAGGKTTALFRLAREASGKNLQSVILSATTHLAEEQCSWADQHFTINTRKDIFALYDLQFEGVILLTGELGEDRRTRGLSSDLISEVEKLAQNHQSALLIEADGSRMKPLKAPADHEPAIPSWVDTVIVVAGMNGLGQELSEDNVHRPEIFGHLSGLKPGSLIQKEHLVEVLLSEGGGLKGIPDGARRIVMLNQCDTPVKAAQGKQMSTRLLSAYGQVILSKLNPPSAEEVTAVHRQVAGVVLAAGGSSRLGRPKQLLEWQGKPFVQAVVETARDSGLSPVIVVIGAYQQEVEAALEGFPVQLVINPDWMEGQATSVRSAVSYLSDEYPQVEAALFFLVDQPQIPSALVQTLLDAYSETFSPITAPMVDDRRGNPVLFDRSTFKELSKLEGDAGGRQVFSRFKVQYIPWLDSTAGLDVDTREDYERLLREFQ
ncbi:MAG: putative selenium-dependent hydroxylase accessory protein YqeC [Gammaproteobacteria bacterium]|nr:putative selenium-dependent hydroxylase accessory protein YqeC [Gammaproteobacteria bacterium]